jgi:Domain of unknown function (DUF4438)
MSVLINRDQLLRTALVGDVTSPVLSFNPYDVDADGAPFVPVGAGGVQYRVKVGMEASGWAADQVEPGASIANPAPAANEALLVYACVGNRAVVRTGAAATAEGVVLGKHEAFRAYKHVLVHFADDVLAKLVPGDRIVVDAEGRGLGVADRPRIACHSLSPRLWDAWAPEGGHDGSVEVRVARILPPEVVGMGSGRVSAATSIALQASFAELEGLRIGDIVAIRQWDATYVTGYHEDAVTIAVVATGDSPVLGNGPAATILMSGPRSEIEPIVDEAANLKTLLDLA